MAEEKMGKLKGFLAEFKKFITRGNVLDMSVGVIVGGAFTAIVNGLSNNILKPLINWLIAALIGKDGLKGAITMLSPSYKDTLNAEGVVIGQELDLAASIYIDWGAFISAVINFLLIAFVLFTIVKVINGLAEAHEKLIDGMELSEKKAIAAYRKQGLKKAEARAKYQEDLKKAAEAKAEAARLEAERVAAEKAAAEEKAMANTRLLEEIRDLLKNK